MRHRTSKTKEAMSSNVAMRSRVRQTELETKAVPMRFQIAEGFLISMRVRRGEVAPEFRTRA